MKANQEDILIKKIQGLATAEEDLEIQAWLAASVENREVYTQFKALWLARNIESYSKDKTIKASIEEINDRIETLIRLRKRAKFIRVIKYAAVIFVLISFSIVLRQMQVNRYNPVMTTIKSGLNNEIRMVELADGSKVWLNSGATLHYPDNFHKRHRDINVEGEVYIEVTKDVGRKFYVNTPTLTVEVTGTAFNLKTRTAGNLFQLVLVKGSVNLLNSSGEKIANLLPGQLANVDPLSDRVEIQSVDTKLYTAWQDGLIILENKGIKEIFTKIEEVYHVELLYDSALIAKNSSKYNFVFKRTQSLQIVMEMVKFVSPLKNIEIKAIEPGK